MTDAEDIEYRKIAAEIVENSTEDDRVYFGHFVGIPTLWISAPMKYVEFSEPLNINDWSPEGNSAPFNG